MDRRRFLGLVAAILPLFAGCNGETPSGPSRSGTTPADETTISRTDTTETGTESSSDPAGRVSVTYRLSGGYTPWVSKEVAVDANGTVRYTLTCAGDTVTETTTETRSGELTDGEYRRLERLLTDEATPGDWADYYDCEGRCPTDLPTVTLTVLVDGTTYETSYYMSVNPPGVIGEVASILRSELNKYPDTLCG